MTISEVFSYGKDYLKSNSVPDYSAEAMLLLKAAFCLDSAKYLMQKNDKADCITVSKFENMLERRVSGEPVQYIIGEWDFCGFNFFVGDGVLIPRPETEQLCDSANELIKEKSYRVIYDLCSGSGCIGLALALENPEAVVFLFEISEKACKYIKRNTEYHKLKNVRLIKCDILLYDANDLPKPDIIISNPPYIPRGELTSLQREVHCEPEIALDGGEDGLVFYRSLAVKWFGMLKAGGCMALECGENQAETIAEYLGANARAEIISDMYGAARFLIAFKQ